MIFHIVVKISNNTKYNGNLEQCQESFVQILV